MFEARIIDVDEGSTVKNLILFTGLVSTSMGLLLTAPLNSTPLRVYAGAYRSIDRTAKEIATISKEITENPDGYEERSGRLDILVGEVYDLTESDLTEMQDFLACFAN